MVVGNERELRVLFLNDGRQGLFELVPLALRDTLNGAGFEGSFHSLTVVDQPSSQIGIAVGESSQSGCNLRTTQVIYGFSLRVEELTIGSRENLLQLISHNLVLHEDDDRYSIYPII